MKILQITDTHMVPGKQDMHGVNPYQRLSACVEDIRQNQTDAELCVITGDLAHMVGRRPSKLLFRLLPGCWRPASPDKIRQKSRLSGSIFRPPGVGGART